MSTEANKAVVRRYYQDVLNDGDVGAIDALATVDYEEHDPLPGQTTGRLGLKQRVSMIRAGLDAKFTIQHLVAEDELVVAHWTNSGVQRAEYLGIPATGRPFTIHGVDIHRLQDGRMAEHWHVVDLHGFLQQLGVGS